ncbi:MAG TPA: hypothetical protein VHE60_06135 [Pyrinomonadaceae bacterium]|nr:hypothetical protein [Pyrinomonadaceae bacterium]
MLRNLSPISSLFMRRQFARIAASAILLLALSVAASAYTIVLRDGRRIEIASEFTLTKSTLTYEIAPGISRTVQLILVDVAATERANNEAPGKFATHAEQKLATPSPSVSPRAQRTLTNRELESIQQRRIESERDYEKRRIELGLPSIEESRQRQEREETATRDRLREQSLSQAREEAYWRERASALRGEISAADAQINYLQARLTEFRQFPLATHSLITSVLPFAPLGSTSAVVPRMANPGTFIAPRVGSAPLGRGQVLINPAPERFRGLRPARPVSGFGFPIGSAFPFASPIRPFDYVEDSYDRANLSDRLDSLLVTRAGLAARWRELEDEARDARVPQVWLEP